MKLLRLALLAGLFLTGPAHAGEAGIPPGLLKNLNTALTGEQPLPEGLRPECGWAALIVSIHGDGEELFRMRVERGDMTAGTGPLTRIPWAEKLKDADALDVVLIGRPRPVVAPGPDAAVYGNASRGRIEIHVSLNGRSRRFSPDKVVARNQSHRYLIGRALKDWGEDWAKLKEAGEVTIANAVWYRAEVRDGSVAPFREVLRGRFTPVPRAGEQREASRSLASAIDWFGRNIGPDGTFPYGYWPSSRRFRKDNNAIRQWLATLALADIAHLRPENHLVKSLLLRNIDGNKAVFVRQWEGRTVVMHDNKIKLGAMGIAALAMLRGSPEAEDTTIRSLLETIMSMQNEDGSFRTFLLPPDRNDNQNFYPGEALLFLAEYQRRHPDPARLERILTSLDYYWAWHIVEGNRNPAFVPWHLMAHVALGPQLIGEKRIQRVFSMADWLAAMQQIGTAPAADMTGRFYAPGKDYGPPHTSSTAIYVEGICHTARLARRTGDHKRAANYDRVMSRALGNLSFLQYRTRRQAPFVSRGDFRKLTGAMPNNSYDNRIRIDNVAHFAGFLACSLTP